MGSFRVAFKPSVEKDLRALPQPLVRRVMKRIEDLAENPLPHGSVKLSSAERLYRIRAGDYRIVYEVDFEAKTVTVHYVRHRRDVYRGIS